jgi:membrane-associated phospholipid phosphatase
MTRRRTILGVCAAIVIYAAMWVGYSQNWGWLRSVDWSLLNAAHGIAIEHPVWVRFWDVVSMVLGPVPLRVLGTAGALVLLVKRKVRSALLLLVCASLSGLVTMAAKSLVNRPRPVTALVTAPSGSFPSGHALETTAGVLALLTVALTMLSRATARVGIAVAGLNLLMVGIARVALNVHYPSDVIAGWALGCLYFVVCLWVFRPVSRRGDPTESKPLLDPGPGPSDD